jgi:hypothetical protein
MLETLYHRHGCLGTRGCSEQTATDKEGGLKQLRSVDGFQESTGSLRLAAEDDKQCSSWLQCLS